MYRIAFLSLIVFCGGIIIPTQAHITRKFDRFDCLPKGVRLDDVVSYRTDKKPNVTVKAKLTEMKARCRGGKLIDAKNKEIRFFRVSCWGYQPPNYLEIKKQENAELEKLSAQYTVIVFGCNPRIK